MQINIRTPDRHGVALAGTVHITPFYFGQDTLAAANSQEQGDVLLGLVMGLLGYQEDALRAGKQAAYIGESAARWKTTRPDLVRRTAQWLREVGDHMDHYLNVAEKGTQG